MAHDTTARRRLLITGATGNLGRLLEERLAGDYDLVTQGRTPKTPQQEETLNRADLDDYSDVPPLMAGVDTVVHLAGAASPESPLATKVSVPWLVHWMRMTSLKVLRLPISRQ